MIYCVSDIYGEYDLFLKLLDKIKFSDSDTLIICGDLIDKGKQSVNLLASVKRMPNVKCILGNHEYDFLKYYWSLMQSSPKDFDETLMCLQQYFPYDGNLLDWKTVDYLENLPCFIEEKDFICVHAGIPLDSSGVLQPLSGLRAEQFVYDRTFKDNNVIPQQSKCVIFGHTPTSYLGQNGKIVKYMRTETKCDGKSICDYYKVHVDTGVYLSRILGCIRIDDCAEFYVSEQSNSLSI